MSCGVGRRCSTDLALLWLWHRPVATAPIRPLAWELPYAAGVALEKKGKKKDEKKIFCPFFDWVFGVFLDKAPRDICTFWRLILVGCFVCEDFLPFCGLSFFFLMVYCAVQKL